MGGICDSCPTKPFSVTLNFEIGSASGIRAKAVARVPNFTAGQCGMPKNNAYGTGDVKCSPRIIECSLYFRASQLRYGHLGCTYMKVYFSPAE